MKNYIFLLWYHCEYIYDNNRNLFEDYKVFAHLKPTIKSRMTKTIKKNLTKGIMYSNINPNILK